MKKKILTGVGIITFSAITGFVVPQTNVFAANDGVVAKANTIKKTEKGTYIKSLNAVSNASKTAKFTVRTTVPFADIDSARIYNANNGDGEYLSYDKVRKINNYTFDISGNNLDAGHWKLDWVNLKNRSGENIWFNQRDLLHYNKGVLVGNAKREEDTNISLRNGEKHRVLPSRRVVNNGEVVKYTFKIKDAEYPIISSLYLVDDKTNSTRYVSPEKYLDGNGNAVVYSKNPYNDRQKTQAVLKVDNYVYSKSLDGDNVKVKRSENFKNDSETSVRYNGATPQPNNVPETAGKKVGVFASHSKIEKGSMLLLTVKSAKAIDSIYVKNLNTNKEYYQGNKNFDSNGNLVFYVNTGNLQPGRYTIKSVEEDGNYFFFNPSIPSSDINLSQATFEVVSAGGSVRRANNPSKPQVKAGWVKENNLWRYRKTDGTFAKNTWIEGNYYVKSNGVMAANEWIKVGNAWYYTKSNGATAKNAWEGNYWLGSDGKMATNRWVDNNRYYVGNDGAWIKDYGRKTGWQKEGGAWYYYKNGSAVRNAWEGNYWLGSDGKMVTNSWVDNNRYYVGNDGAWIKDYRRTGWTKESGVWYYYKDGSRVRNAWEGNYWLGSDGKMATNSWVDNNRYYVGNDGAWIKDYRRTGWVKESGVWYYYKNGNRVKNAWEGNYWLGADGRMATNSWVDNNRYYVGNDGAWDSRRK